MKKLTKSQVTRQDVMRRANEIRRWSKNYGYGYGWGACLAAAWKEARTGNTQEWLWLSDDHMIAQLEWELHGARVCFDDELAAHVSRQIAAIKAKSTPLQIAA